MKDSDKKNFCMIIFGCGEYYGKQIPSGVIEIYWQGLKTFGIDELQRAINLHMADPDAGHFMPKISDITKILAGSKQTRAMMAWSQVSKAVKQVGPWESVCFDDPIIHRVLQDMGGWIYLCGCLEKDFEFKMHEFAKRYQGYVLQGSIPDHPAYLIGLTEANNAEQGFSFDKPTLIGDSKKAFAILEGPRNEFGEPKEIKSIVRGVGHANTSS